MVANDFSMENPQIISLKQTNKHRNNNSDMSFKAFIISFTRLANPLVVQSPKKMQYAKWLLPRYARTRWGWRVNRYSHKQAATHLLHVQPNLYT